ncbi:polysaccharide deacetylase family protein [soil metagenome]
MRAILTFHSVDASGSVISIHPRDFRRLLAWLAGGGPLVTTIEHLLSLPADADAVALTFDDGFANFATDAWPVLREYGFPATIFLPSDLLGKKNLWDRAERGAIPLLPLLDWPTTARLAEEGVTLGAHSRTHADLRTLGETALREELRGAKEEIRRETGHEPEGFAYPFGYCDAATVSAAGQWYAWACTAELRPLAAREDLLRLPRLDAYYLRGAGRLESWGSPRFARYLWMRNRARRLRRALSVALA